MLARLFFWSGLFFLVGVLKPDHCLASLNISGTVVWEGKQTVAEEVVIQNGSQLIIKEGSLVEFKKGGSIMANGSLLAQGQAEAPIVFFREKALPDEPRWSYYFYLGNSSVSVLDHIIVKEAGGYFEGGSGMPGFRIKGNLEINNSLITNNTWALEVRDSGRLKIRNCEIYGNKATWGLQVVGTLARADAIQNYWGDDSGPYHSTLNKTGKGETVLGSGLEITPWITKGRRPILLVPGLGEALSFQKFFKERDAPTDWFLAPSSSGTQFLKELFLASGYREGVDLFVYFYDWRREPALALTGLKTLIDQIRADTGFWEVDLIGFSYGGLIARNYLISEEFNFDVRQFIALGTPHLGSAKIYSFLEGGILPANWPPLVYAYLWWRKKESGKEYWEYIQEEFTALPALLPMNPFLINEVDNALISLDAMHFQNQFLPIINESSAINKLKNNTAVHFFAGEGQPTIGLVMVNRSETRTDNYWPDGIPDPWPIQALANGDGTVIKESATLEGSGIGRTFFGAKHTNLPLVVGQNLANLLGITLDAQKMSEGIINNILGKKTLVLAVASPVLVEVSNLAGEVLSQATINSFGSFWSDQAPAGKKIIFIPEPENEYTITFLGEEVGDYDLLVFDYDTEKEEPPALLEFSGNTFSGKEEQFILTKEVKEEEVSLDSWLTKPIPSGNYKKMVQTVESLYVQKEIKNWSAKQEVLSLLLKSYNFLLMEKTTEKTIAYQELMAKINELKATNRLTVLASDSLVSAVNLLE